MKKETATISKFIVGFVCLIITFSGCTDEISKTGLGILPTGDLVTVRKWVSKKEMIKAYTLTDVKQRTDKPGFNLLGTFNDPIFGKTTADFATQFRLKSFPDFKNHAQPDSLVLHLLYNEVYGFHDTLPAQTLKVYELASSLVFDNTYYQDVDLKGLAKSELLAEKTYTPKFKLDSLTNTYGSTKAHPKDTVIQEIAIKLDLSLARKLMAADSLTLSDNDKFLQYFKGLYVEAGDLNKLGGIMRIYTLASGSSLVLHYHNDLKNSLSYIYGINANTARVDRFTHDYSKTAFAANLDKETGQDSLIYLQTTGGLRSKILIPSLGSWGDSANVAINKAELIFQVDSTVTNLKKMVPPKELVLTAIGVNKAGQDSAYFPSDLAFSSIYFGGTYKKSDGTYRFNIAKHLQEVSAKKKENRGFYLSTAFRSSIFRRIALKGMTSKTGIRLEVTYSKIN